jgi:hypothetical protein
VTSSIWIGGKRFGGSEPTGPLQRVMPLSKSEVKEGIDVIWSPFREGGAGSVPLSRWPPRQNLRPLNTFCDEAGTSLVTTLGLLSIDIFRSDKMLHEDGTRSVGQNAWALNKFGRNSDRLGIAVRCVKAVGWWADGSIKSRGNRGGPLHDSAHFTGPRPPAPNGSADTIFGSQSWGSQPAVPQCGTARSRA